MTYQIAICDDNAEDIRYVETLVKQWAGRQGHTASILCYPSARCIRRRSAKNCFSQGAV